MAELDPPSPDSEPVAASRRRLGLALFAIYLALYTGFVLVNAIAPERMSWTPGAGVNLAVLYGLGLIAAAFALALVYEVLCRRIERSDSRRGGEAR